MSQTNADRNLLFGIIALQMDFITRDQLVGAMQDWVFDKSNSLGAILLKKGVLAEDTRSLLEALVKKHLAQHNNDPEKSLASVSTVGSVKEELRRVADPDLQASLIRVAATRPDAPDPFATRAPSIGEATSTGLRFRILRPHARGGLGEVHIARDEELAREVALKQIQESHADDHDSQLRFKLEAEITGGLEHPGIVPVYGLGQYADGRPFYAMRFIRGHSLKEACERFHKVDGPFRDPGERSLGLRSLLGRLVDVCNAIAYAHSRGVLHRDLKPGNIMLGKYGETLVVDWGLAKTANGPVSDNTEPGEGTLTPSSASLGSQTVMGSAMGTPQFMSPEQASGRLDQLGPASDVYSLGATLYCLLTGQPPFNDPEVGTVLTKVQRGEFPPPRQLKAEVPKALEAICLKAMALKPADRYQSPRDLADDIEHWLADEPVIAWKEPWTVKARRWVSRHRTLVAGAVAAVVVATVGLAVATVLLTAANERERKAKESAIHNFQLAQQAVDDYYTDVSENVLLREPNMEPLRKKLLERARKYYDVFVAEHGDDPEVKGELGNAIYRLAQITGDIDTETKAIALHEQAREIFVGLTKANPQNPDWQSYLAKCWHNLGRLNKNADQLAKAQEDYQHALDIWQPLAAAHPQEDVYRAELARSQLGLGNVYQKNRQWEKARAIYETALETRGNLAKEHPDNQEYQRDFALSASNLARVYAALGLKDNKARQAFDRALKIQGALVAEFPRISQYQNDLARSYYNLGDLDAPSDESIKLYDKAASLWKELVNKHYAVTDFHINLAETYMAQAEAYRSSGNLAKGEEAAKNAMDMRKKLALEHKDIVSYQVDLARGYFQLGDVYRTAEKTIEAESAYQQALSILEKLASLAPAVPQIQSDLARSYTNLGLLYADRKENSKAEEGFRKALSLWEKLERSHPEDLDFARQGCITAYHVGNLFRSNGNAQVALEWYERAIRPVEELGPEQRRDPAIMACLATVYWKRAETLTQQGRPTEALRDWTRGLEYADAAKRPLFQLHHTLALARAGEHSQAAGAANELRVQAKTGGALYQLATVYALSLGALAADTKLSANVRQGLSDQYTARALELLEKLQMGGFFQIQANLYRLKNDAELAPLRSRPEYRQLVGDLEKRKKPAS